MKEFYGGSPAENAAVLEGAQLSALTVVAAANPQRASDFPPPRQMNQVELLASLSEDYGGRLEALFPKLPFGIRVESNGTLAPGELRRLRAERLGVAMSYRVNFVQRPDTPKTNYQYPPAEGEPADPLFGEALVNLMRTDGRVAENNLLGRLPNDKIDVTPQTFGELVAGGEGWHEYYI